MKMYSQDDNNSNSNNNGTDAHIVGHKDTLHISPHITVHKSNINNTSENASIALSTDINEKEHAPPYKIGIPASFYKGNVSTESFISTVRMLPGYSIASTGTSQLGLIKSSHRDSGKFLTATDNASQKTSHVHSVESLSNSVITTDTPRTPVTIYRLVDGTTISAGVPIILTPVGSGNHNSLGHSLEAIHTIEVPASVSSAISLQEVIPTESEGTTYILPDCVEGNFISLQESIIPIPEKGINNSRQLECIKEENIFEHKDLVRQALQEAVAQNSGSRMSPNSQAINYNYSSEDIGELLMMNINVNADSGEAMVVGTHSDEVGAPIVVIQQASASMVDSEGIITQAPLAMMSGTRRGRVRLSDEAQLLRREKIAIRMREKRANESEEQKEKRRLREAERMRRKRSQEDEIAKDRRRREAANRARLRRAKLSSDEREDERKKAALRMRLRRQNENEQQKRYRRIKAAERMRRRRATETVEQKANRRCIHRFKTRKKKKDTSIDSESVQTVKEEPKLPHHCEFIQEQVVVSEQQFHRPQIMMSPSRFPSNVTVYGLPDMESSSPVTHHTTGNLPSMEVISSALESISPHAPPLSVRSVSSPPTHLLEREPPPIYPKETTIYLTQECAQNLSQNNHMIKETSHRHLPHLPSNLSPQQDEHHMQQTNIQSVQVRQHNTIPSEFQRSPS